VLGILLLATFAVCTQLLFGFLDQRLNPKPSYTSYVGSIEVMQSRMSWVQTSNGPRIYLTGVFTNRSPVAWRDIELECRFFDTNGILVDAANPRTFATIQPFDDRAFRAVVQPGRDFRDYASNKLSVSTARNTKGNF
jgi:hypothetical protein